MLRPEGIGQYRRRGLADFTSDDASFQTLVEHRCFAPLEPL